MMVRTISSSSTIRMEAELAGGTIQLLALADNLPQMADGGADLPFECREKDRQRGKLTPARAHFDFGAAARYAGRAQGCRAGFQGMGNAADFLGLALGLLFAQQAQLGARGIGKARHDILEQSLPAPALEGA